MWCSSGPVPLSRPCGDLAARRLRRGELLRRDHRDPVAVPAGEPDADAAVLLAVVAPAAGADRVAGRERPVDLDVGEHVRALEREPDLLADQAVRAVAAHEVLRPHGGLRSVPEDRRDHALVVLRQAGQLAAALDHRAERREVLAKDPLRLVRRQADAAVGDVVGQDISNRPASSPYAIGDLPAKHDARRESVPGDADLVPDLERARCTPIAFAQGATVSRRSMTRTSTPRRRSSSAVISPTGPAPTTITSVSTGRYLLRRASERSGGASLTSRSLCG
jgi:hypothetical protein